MIEHLLACFAVVAVSGPGASAPPADTLRVTWPDIVRLVDEHPRLAAARYDVVAARGAAAAAGTLPNPSLDATGARGVPPHTTSEDREWSLELALPLGWLTQRAYRVGDAAAQLEASREEARAVRLDVLLELRTLYWGLAHEQARAEALESLHDQTAELARLVSRRVEKGEARPSEATRAAIELEKVDIELDATRARLLAAQEQARLWLHGGGGRELRVAADLAVLHEVPELEPLRRGARAAHPAVLAARARVRGLSSALALENAARLPQLEVRGFMASEPDRRMRGGGVTVGLPLWDWNSGRVAEARGRLESGRRGLEWETRRLEAALIEAHGAARAAAGAAVRYRDRILPGSESAAAIMEKAYRLGEASLIEVMDARRVLVETRLDYLAALLQAQLAASQLDALAGREETR